MRWRKQKRGVPNCGLVALAVVTNKSLKFIIKLMGYNGRTNTEDLVGVLRKLGYECPNRLRRLKIQPKLSIAKVSIPNSSNWHWIVVYKGKIFDGANGDKYGNYKWKKGWRITSYLPIEKRI